MDDPLDPDIRRFVEAVKADWARHPPLDGLSIPQARAVAEQVRRRWTLGGPAMAETRDVSVPTEAGRLRPRIHRPVGVAASDAPALLYLHGGGFVVIGIDYPLSPEGKYPVALDPVTALVRWLGSHGGSLGIDARRVAIGGDSAGANLALATCLKLRDAGDATALRGMLSNYGAFSGRCSDAAEARYGGPDAVLTQAEMVYYFEKYLETPAQLDLAYACPLAATDLSGLPPIALIIPERDVLTEQSLAIAERLRAIGSDVTATIYRGATHSFLEAIAISPLARDALWEGADWVKRRLQR